MEWLAKLIPGKIITLTWNFSFGGETEGEEDNASFFDKFGEEVGGIGSETAVLAVTFLLLKFFASNQLEELEKRYSISIFIYGVIMFLVMNILAIVIYMMHKTNIVLFCFSLVSCVLIFGGCAVVFFINPYKSLYKCEVIPATSRMKQIENFKNRVVNFFKERIARRKEQKKEKKTAKEGKDKIENKMKKEGKENKKVM